MSGVDREVVVWIIRSKNVETNISSPGKLEIVTLSELERRCRV
ncbi:MAG: hypothetical protein QXH35_02465 [Nitrososphaerota archaeon]